MPDQEGRKPYPVRRPHRPSILDPDIIERLVTASRAGASMLMAADHAGVSDRVFRRWMEKGAETLWNIEENDAEYDPDDQDDQHLLLCLDLYLQITKARADRAVKDVALIHRSAEGGAVTEETVRKYRDPDTHEVVEEKTIKRAPPDWRAAAWYLERQYRRHGFGREETVELVGSEGGPVQVERDMGALADRLAERIAGRAAAHELTRGADGDGGEVVDAEVVDGS